MLVLFEFCTRLRRCRLALMVGALVALTTFGASAASLILTPAQTRWIQAQGDKVFTVGFDPYAGMDDFEFRGQRVGLLPNLLKDMQATLGLRFAKTDMADWDGAYSGFVRGKIDILYGANPTPERQRTMVFTRAAQRYPYVVLARKDSSIQTLGDLDGKKVGFITNDFVRQQLPDTYRNIHFQAMDFDTNNQALAALRAGTVDGFVAAGGGIEKEILFSFPDIALAARLPAITSDMTFAVMKDRAMLGEIINRYIDENTARIASLARDAERSYNLKIMRLTAAELAWLDNKGKAVVGVAEDYLPFDLYQDGEYRGIAGEMLKRITEISGIQFTVVSGPFATVYKQAQAGEIDVLNIAKTDDRLAYFLYPRAISTERDIIVGLKTSPAVQDVYGLEGKRVAVIDGFWHVEHLQKNLRDAKIVTTASIMESLKLLREGKVDYTIENPTVVEFYINGLGYTDVVKRGSTSKDSFVYFGVNKQKPELASIMDKAMSLVNFEEIKYAGIQSVPTLKNEKSQRLALIAAGLAAALIAVLLVTIKVVRSLAAQKNQTLLLEQREHLLYTDALTGFHNRNYFSHTRSSLQTGIYPQAVLIADLNNLKLVNDAYGHAAGDAILVLYAKAIRTVFPQAACFRLGGDEFLVVVDDTTAEEMDRQVRALHVQCQQQGHTVMGETLHATAAVGFAMRRGSQDALEACMAIADARMYEAKLEATNHRSDSPPEAWSASSTHQPS
ncbi:transporter substrate-binding domain-containing protein [Rhodoferax sp. PAMC 29310]|uniref:transporter substrate-binding domain-containing diguanylate cyclase n=1 Tax=Rhodoferax sp. PAMC 29310 TaxID=2822760 RepID=UPI001B334C0F|nr:transporter substrate-binding domain-containing protein [Rhodoferax sp. PAMC 29310]